MKEFIKKMPVIGSLARKINRKLFYKPRPFSGSKNFWEHKYDSGGNSGPGSYNQLANFKAEILNHIVKDNKILKVIEYGCGDGNQLRLAEYPSYIGFDVSQKAISLCEENFLNDQTKIFKLMSQYNGETAELTLSLDVIFHLIEDDIFYCYMKRLFDSSE